MPIPILNATNASLSSPVTTQEKKHSKVSQKETFSSLLMEDLASTKRDIETLLLHLDYQTDPDLIDYYIYQLKGAYTKYKFQLKQIQKTANKKQ